MYIQYLAFVSFLVVFGVNLALNCSVDQKERKDSNGSPICCFTVICNTSQGFHLCKMDQGYDTCFDCTSDQFTTDKINTYDADVEISVCQNIPQCDQESQYLNKTTYQCICDRSKGFYGGPNNCQRANSICNTAGNELGNEGTCVPCGEDMFKPYNDKSVCMPKTKCKDDEIETGSGSRASNRICSQRTSPVTTIATVTSTTDSEEGNNSDSSIIVGIVVGLLLLAILAALVICCRRGRHCQEIFRSGQPEVNPDIEADPEQVTLLSPEITTGCNGYSHVVNENTEFKDPSDNSNRRKKTVDGNIDRNSKDEIRSSGINDESQKCVKWNNSCSGNHPENISTLSFVQGKKSNNPNENLNSEGNVANPQDCASYLEHYEDIDQTSVKGSTGNSCGEFNERKFEDSNHAEEGEQIHSKTVSDDSTDITCLKYSYNFNDESRHTLKESSGPGGGNIPNPSLIDNLDTISSPCEILNNVNDSEEVESRNPSDKKTAENTIRNLPPQAQGKPIATVTPMRPSRCQVPGPRPSSDQVSGSRNTNQTTARQSSAPAGQTTDFGNEMAEPSNIENSKPVYNAPRPSDLSQYPNALSPENMVGESRQPSLTPAIDDNQMNLRESSDDYVAATSEGPTNQSLPILSQQPESASYRDQGIARGSQTEEVDVGHGNTDQTGMDAVIGESPPLQGSGDQIEMGEVVGETGSPALQGMQQENPINHALDEIEGVNGNSVYPETVNTRTGPSVSEQRDQNNMETAESQDRSEYGNPLAVPESEESGQSSEFSGNSQSL